MDLLLEPQLLFQARQLLLPTRLRNQLALPTLNMALLTCQPMRTTTRSNAITPPSTQHDQSLTPCRQHHYTYPETLDFAVFALDVHVENGNFRTFSLDLCVRLVHNALILVCCTRACHACGVVSHDSRKSATTQSTICRRCIQIGPTRAIAAGRGTMRT